MNELRLGSEDPDQRLPAIYRTTPKLTPRKSNRADRGKLVFADGGPGDLIQPI